MSADSKTSTARPSSSSDASVDRENQSYEQRWREVHREQQQIIKTLRLSSQVVGLNEFLAEAVQAAAKVLNADLAQILEHDQASHSFRVRAGVGWRDNAAEQLVLSPSDGAKMAYAWVVNGPVVVERLDRTAAFAGPGLLNAYGVVSAASVTIPGQEGPFGVLSVYATSHRMFTRDEVEFLQRVANVVSAAAYRWKAGSVEGR